MQFHKQEKEQPYLHVSQAVMVLVQDLLRLPNVEVLLAVRTGSMIIRNWDPERDAHLGWSGCVWVVSVDIGLRWSKVRRKANGRPD